MICVRLQICHLVQVFDPIYAVQHLTPSMVTELSEIKALEPHVKIEDLLTQLPAYLASAARAATYSLENVDDYSAAILNFWRVNTSHASMPAWRSAARIIFAMSPNSASCERVFSLLDCMFGEGQSRSLADVLQASLMLRFNGDKRTSVA